jgi:ornithine cyclodeaminase
MTEFVDVRNMVRCVMATGAEQVIAGIAGYLRADFRRWGSFDKTPRMASHTSFGVIELMPVCDPVTYAFKYVNGHPLNPARGFQTVTAFGALADVSTGYPVFLAEMTLWHGDHALPHRALNRRSRPVCRAPEAGKNAAVS